MAVKFQAYTSRCTCVHVWILWDLPHTLLTLMCGWEIPNLVMEQLITSMYSYMLIIGLLYLTMLIMSFKSRLESILIWSKIQSCIQICTLVDIWYKLHLIMEWEHGLLALLNNFRLQWIMSRITWRSKWRSLSLRRDTLIHWLATIFQILTSLMRSSPKMRHNISPWLAFPGV